jgi:hypothetical protein
LLPIPPVRTLVFDREWTSHESGFIAASHQQPVALSIPTNARFIRRGSEAMNIHSQTMISPLRSLFRVRK